MPEESRVTPEAALPATLVVNRQLQVLCADGRYSGLVGKPLAQITGEALTEVLIPDDVFSVMVSGVEQVFDSGEPWKFSAESICGNQSVACRLEIRAYLLQDISLVGIGLLLSEHVEYAIPARHDRIRGVVDSVYALATRRCFMTTSQDMHAVHLRLAIDEALQNAIEHGCRADATQIIHVSVSVSPYRLTITVRDPGNGFSHTSFESPEPALSSRSRGILLMRSVADDVMFHGTGNTVTLIFDRSTPRPFG